MSGTALIWMLTAAGLFVVAGVILNLRLKRDAKLAVRVHVVQRTVGIEAVVGEASQPRLLRVRRISVRRSRAAGCCPQRCWRTWNSG